MISPGRRSAGRAGGRGSAGLVRTRTFVAGVVCVRRGARVEPDLAGRRRVTFWTAGFMRARSYRVQKASAMKKPSSAPTKTSDIEWPLISFTGLLRILKCGERSRMS